MVKEFYFENVDNLVEYLLFKYKELTPLKLQKSLYFLFGFYAGTYQQSEAEGELESTYQFPKYLFDAEFEAWTYGPVIKDVYFKNKRGEYTGKNYDFSNKYVDAEINKFIDDVSEMIMKKSDFALVDRTHEDKVWKEAISKGKSTEMKKEDIASEYREIFQSVE
jgi:orf24